ncbi:hypothetical protein NDU88_006721 [Pleurodeles waltl]|uniref:Uncharacterized protein n=1 Tax=Pleurodeles waltl TaxID=8319 RepID=A0AAV7VPW9_PLEWA|nr:hypothetical protein NDU88_006721 [Pleurodeles waltl]
MERPVGFTDANQYSRQRVCKTYRAPPQLSLGSGRRTRYPGRTIESDVRGPESPEKEKEDAARAHMQQKTEEVEGAGEEQDGRKETSGKTWDRREQGTSSEDRLPLSMPKENIVQLTYGCGQAKSSTYPEREGEGT